jgi:hypothetical protein
MTTFYFDDAEAMYGNSGDRISDYLLFERFQMPVAVTSVEELKEKVLPVFVRAIHKGIYPFGGKRFDADALIARLEIEADDDQIFVSGLGCWLCFYSDVKYLTRDNYKHCRQPVEQLLRAVA